MSANHVRYKDGSDRITIISSGTKHDGNMGSAAVTLRDNKLLGIDNASILDDISCNSSIVLDKVRIHCLQASDLRLDGCLVAAESSEDLLTRNSIGLIDSVVRAVGGAIIAVQSKSNATTKIALGNRTGNQVLADDSRRAEQSTNGSGASTSTDL